MKKTVVLLGLGLGAVIFGSGCGATQCYSGPERPRNEVAVVTCIQPPRPRIGLGFLGVPSPHPFLQVQSVDGQALRFEAVCIAVLPGDHNARVGYCTPGTIAGPIQPIGEADVKLSVEAGGSYEILAVRQEDGSAEVYAVKTGVPPPSR